MSIDVRDKCHSVDKKRVVSASVYVQMFIDSCIFSRSNSFTSIGKSTFRLYFMSRLLPMVGSIVGTLRFDLGH